MAASLLMSGNSDYAKQGAGAAIASQRIAPADPPGRTRSLE